MGLAIAYVDAPVFVGLGEIDVVIGSDMWYDIL